MKKSIFYGDETITVKLPDATRDVPILDPVPAIKKPEERIEEALENPIAHGPLHEIVKPGAKVTIAFDDPAIPFTPMAGRDFREMTISILIKKLTEAGVKRKDIELLCANGLHRKWTRKELGKIIGMDRALKMPPNKLYCHDAEDRDNLVYLGETDRGFEVEVSRKVIDSDQLFYINITATPFNGGWKSVIVGLSSFRSIRHHHRSFPSKGRSVMDPRLSAFQKLLWDMGEVVVKRLKEEGKRIFIIESALNNKDPPQLIDVNAGHPTEVHVKTLQSVYKQQVVELEGQSDVLVIGVHNLSPYAKHSIMNPLLVTDTGLEYGFRLYQNAPVVREGGIVILVHPWEEQFDEIRHPSYIEFYDRVLNYTKDPFEAWDLFAEEFAHRPEYVHKYRHSCAFHGSHPFFMWNSTEFPKRHAREIFAAGAKNFDVPNRLGFKPFKTVEDAIKESKEILGRDISITHHRIQPVTIAKIT